MFIWFRMLTMIASVVGSIRLVWIIGFIKFVLFESCFVLF